MRATMPHVVTQWEMGQWSREGIESGRARANSENLRPITFSPINRHSGGLRTKKNLNFPGTPEGGRWDFGSIRHIKQGSTEMRTPVSAVDSVFELPCNESHASPNSSAHSSFLAELEATSPVTARHSKRLVSPVSSTPLATPLYPAPPKGLHLQDHSMDFKSAGNAVSLNMALTVAMLTHTLSLVP